LGLRGSAAAVTEPRRSDAEGRINGNRTVLWHGVDPFSAEMLRFERSSGGWQMRGVVLVELPLGATEVRYELRTDGEWRSRHLRVEMSGGHEATLDMTSDGLGAWTIAGEHLPSVDGCIDIDLGVSPSTNTLPIRRLDPAVGEIVTTTVAWIRFPELTVQPDEQTYERLDDRRWLFRSDDFAAELEVDEEGLIARYGDLWARIAPVD
jgi:hypothetical protein